MYMYMSCHTHTVLYLMAGVAASSSGEPDAAGQTASVTIVAAVSGKAVLPCPVEKPFNDSVDLILWFRGESETALYSLDARAGSFQRARHFPSDDLSSRAFIDITGRPTSLVIENIKSDDAGLYKCRVGEYDMFEMLFEMRMENPIHLLMTLHHRLSTGTDPVQECASLRHR